MVQLGEKRGAYARDKYDKICIICGKDCRVNRPDKIPVCANYSCQSEQEYRKSLEKNARARKRAKEKRAQRNGEATDGRNKKGANK